MKSIPKAVDRAIKTEIDELGMSGCGLDLRSMQHEKLYSRLYIS
jgi:urease accessory protein UreF